MSISEQERVRRRREARRRARRREQITLGIIAAVVVIAVVSVSVAVSHANVDGDASPSYATKRTTTTTSATTTTTTEKQDPITVSTTATTTAATSTTAATTGQNTAGHYVQPAGAAWNLILVNDWNTMSPSVTESMELTVINQSAANGSVDSRIAEPLRQMIAACRKVDPNLWAQSMYRSYDSQKSLYERQVAKMKNQGLSQAEAEIKAATVVKRPGQSEHNTGLAVDFNNCDESFTGTKAYQWLIEHCHEYGFILRFPEGKEDITGVIFESWHYRYVGVEAATEIMRDGITLEEYCERHGL